MLHAARQRTESPSDARVRARMRELASAIRHHDHLYYDLDPLLSLRQEDLLDIERFAPVSVHNLVTEIERAKTTDLARFVHALGIPGVGVQTAIDLARDLGTLDALLAADGARLEQVEGIGPTLARSIGTFFADAEHRVVIRACLERGLVIRRAAPAARSGPLAGKTVVLTGTLTSMTRAEAESRIRALGGRAHARQLGSPTIDEAERLPELLRLEDIKGDLHVHTDATDGVNSLREMIEACAARGYEYVAITDHTKAVRVAGGLDRAGFRRQRRAIDALRAEFPRLTILHGAEVDILADGTLDLDDAALAALDVVVAAVHSHLAMPQVAMTERILRALAHPRVDILAHPTGRILGKREPYAVDLGQVVRAARDHRVLLEINAQPERLDRGDVLVRMARDGGVKLVVDTDSHRVAELDFVRYGVDQARRGWCTADDVANTRSLDAFLALLRSRGATDATARASTPRPVRAARTGGRHARL